MSVEPALKLWSLPHPKVLVVGDLILDVDYHGRAERFAAEAAGCPVFAAERTEQREGGAGAVRAMAEALGADAVMVRGPRVSRKHRYFADGRQIFRADGDAPPLTAGEAECVIRDVTAALESANVVLVADYGKGVCTGGVLRAAIDGAKAKGIPCVIDPHYNQDWLRYKGATAVKCNWPEWRSADEATRDAEAILIVTFGAESTELFPPGEPYESFPVRPRSVADVCGAGDMVLAALGVCVGGGLDWPDACKIANAAAGLKVERRGAVGVPRAEVVMDLVFPQKIIPADLLPAVRAAATRGRKVAFANGCFDCLHAGHLHLLAEATRQGDVLVVGLNSDASVRALKGSGRPIHSAEDRAALLAGLACVDYVVPFDAPTPAELAKALRPDVLVKGADWRGRDVAGSEHAGRVHFVDLLPGRSTSLTVARMSRPV